MSRKIESEIKNIEDLQKYMKAIVDNSVPSPFYYYMELEEENTDNYWWTDDNKAYQLLREINSYGFSTSNSQDGEPEEGDIYIGRSYVAGFIHKDNLNKINTIKSLGYMVTKGKYDRRKKLWGDRNSSDIIVLNKDERTGREAMWSSQGFPDEEFLDLFEYMPEKVKNKIRKNMIYVNIVDIMWKRSAVKLFTDIVNVLKI